MKDFSSDLAELRRRIGEAAQYLNIETSRGLLVELEGEVAKPDLWNDQEHAKKVNSQYASLKADIDQFNLLSATIDDLCVLHELARAEDDATQEPELEKGVASCRSQLDSLEMRSMFTGEHDECDVILQINAKDGGVDAQDWSEMLLRMYRRWAERRGFAFEIGDVSIGTEAGILSADVTIRGRYAYGLLTSERGTHRLVRISQHVNKTSSAVRLIHEPTGLVASSQQERSQLQNRESAMKRLKAMIIAQDEEEKAAALSQIAGKQAQVGWGSQIRSYVLQPYQMVKDLRSSVESSNVTAVLDGDLDEFMEGFLRWRRSDSE